MTGLKKISVYAAVMVLAAAVGLALAIALQPREPMHALVLDTPRALPEFDLVDHHGEAFGPDRLIGSWNLIFFGFTRCPDVCPTTLQTLAGVQRELSDLDVGRQPSVIMISVDPVHDTPETMASYVPYFAPEFTGVTGDMSEILALTSGLGVAFTYVKNDDGEGYTVEHTAAVFLVDPAGRLQAVFGTPHAIERIARDYRRIVRGRA